MEFRSRPDALQKLALIGDANEREVAGDPVLGAQQAMPGFQRRNIPLDIQGVLSCITEASTPQGKKPLLMAMVTTACEMDCYYCPFRAGRGVMRRITFQPDELARAFNQLVRAGLVDGIFISSGIIKGGIATQDKIIDTVEIIRKQYQYRGYVHLKIMPGAQYAQVIRAMQLADRVSVNLEGPTQERLDALAPKKDFNHDLLERLTWTQRIRESEELGSPRRVRASAVTQFVVGAVGDTDLEHLTITAKLYSQINLRRAYYSAFHPVESTPFENLAYTPALREFRLYQSSFLLRDYDWDVEELSFQKDGNLRLDVDPKRAWADDNLRETPVEVMQADRRDLMRVPGVGPKGAAAIINARRQGNLTDLSHLRNVGIHAPERAAPYVLLNGRRPPRQLGLFEQTEQEEVT